MAASLRWQDYKRRELKGESGLNMPMVKAEALALDAGFDAHDLIVDLMDGRTISAAPGKPRPNIKNNVHCHRNLDEDLSTEGLLRGARAALIT